MSLSYTITETDSDFNRKSQFLSPTVYLSPSLTQFPLEFCNVESAVETRIMSLPDGGKSLMICAFVSIQYQSMLWYKKYRALHAYSMLTRDKNDCIR